MVDDRCRRRRSAAQPVDEFEAAVGAEEEADADVAAGLAAVLVVNGSILPNSYSGPPAARIAAISVFQVTSVRHGGVGRAPSLSWISSIARTSGERRWFTIRSAWRANEPSLGSRFSTL